MSMRLRPKGKQPELWIATSDLARTPGHPFYDRLNTLLGVGVLLVVCRFRGFMSGY